MNRREFLKLVGAGALFLSGSSLLYKWEEIKEMVEMLKRRSIKVSVSELALFPQRYVGKYVESCKMLRRQVGI